MKPMVIEHVEVEMASQKLYPMREAAKLLGLTLPALRAQVWRGRVHAVPLGRRRLISAAEIDRVQGLGV